MRVKAKGDQHGAVVDVLYVFGEGTAAAWRCECGGEDAILSDAPRRLSCEQCGKDWPLVPFAECRREDLAKLVKHYRNEASRERRRPDGGDEFSRQPVADYDEIADAAEEVLMGGD
jgi:hypothetical protein